MVTGGSAGTGGTKISPGCKNCYAETFAERWRGIEGHPYEQGFDLEFVPEKLGELLRWVRRRTPRRIFVNSMSDLFLDGVNDAFITRVFASMNAAPWHTYQVLTKRAPRLATTRAQPSRIVAQPHIWLGVSAEDKKCGVPRIQWLREEQAGVRFLSVEPLLEDLGTIDLRDIDWVIVGGESGPRARPMRSEWVVSIREKCISAGVPFFFK